MLAEEGGQNALRVIINIARGTVNMTCKLGAVTASSLGDVMRLGSAGLRQAATRRLETGQLSLTRLQRVSGGSLGSPRISPQVIRSLRADLRRRGVNFSMEKGVGGVTQVSFTGKDVNTVSHGLSKVGARLKKDVTRTAPRQGMRAVSDSERPRSARTSGKKNPVRAEQRVKGVRDIISTIHHHRQPPGLPPSSGTPRPHLTRGRGAL